MSDLTRLEYFAAAALTGICANPAYFGVTDIEKAVLSVKAGKALREEIDRFYDPDYLDPDPPGEGAADA